MLRFLSSLSNYSIIQKFILAFHRNPHILIYHMVGKSKPEYYYNQPITEDEFKMQIEWLKKLDFEFVPLSEISQKDKGKKRIAITTDDGFVENYSVIAPILSDYNISASFFLLNDYIDNKDLMWRNKLFMIENSRGKEKTSELLFNLLREKQLLPGKKNKMYSVYDLIPMKEKEIIASEAWTLSGMPDIKEYMVHRKPYLNSTQVFELMNAGFTIGSHTFSHPDCSLLSFEELQHEICNSITDLSDRFRTNIEFFAYPFGKRPAKDFENKLLHQTNAKAFLGTKNSDSDLSGNRIWERDKMEQPYEKSLFWFTFIPFFRRFALKPMGLYK